MKEASSRYVDQITLEKLVTEKLAKVHHFPRTGIDFNDAFFADWQEYLVRTERSFQNDSGFPEPISETEWRFQSLVHCDYAENCNFKVQHFKSAAPVANLLFYHGLFEENREIYHFLFENLTRLGLDVYFCTMPFHYERIPEQSAFSGEFFWSAYFERTRNAFRQAVCDFHLVRSWIEKQSSLPLMIGGFSMGGAVALIYSSFHRTRTPVVALNPAVSLSEILWDSPLCKTIKADYLDAGYSIHQLQQAYSGFEPISYPAPSSSHGAIFLGYGCYDMVTSPTLYQSLITKWNLIHSKEYKSGHLNLLRVPRVANDIFNFWQEHGTR